MRFDTLRRIDSTRHQNIGTQVVKTFPLVRSHFTQIIKRGFRSSETAPIGLRFFAVAFADKNHRSVFGLLQQWEQRTGQAHRCNGIDTVLVDPFRYGLKVQWRQGIEIAGAMHHAIQFSACGFINSFRELLKLFLLCAHQIKADSKRLRTASSHNGIIYFFQTLLMTRNQNNSRSGSRIGFGNLLAQALGCSGNQDGFVR